MIANGQHSQKNFALAGFVIQRFPNQTRGLQIPSKQIREVSKKRVVSTQQKTYTWSIHFFSKEVTS